MEGKECVRAMLQNNGGRRSGFDRREFTYTQHIPERRRGADRRGDPDRRNGFDQRSSPMGRRYMDRDIHVRMAYESLRIKNRFR